MKKRLPIIVCLVVIAVLIGIGKLFNTCTHPPAPDHTKEIKADEQKLAALDSSYKVQLTALQSRCDSLEFALAVTKLKLKAANQKLDGSKAKVIRHARKDTIGKTDQQIITDCDSLKAEALLFASEVDTVRTLYEQRTTELEALVANKDSTIELCNNSYMELKMLTDQQFERQHQLSEELQQSLQLTQKKVRRGRLVTIGLTIATTAAGTLYLISTSK